jgi:DNA invertase Pin-like site-specific DNA recombinase
MHHVWSDPVTDEDERRLPDAPLPIDSLHYYRVSGDKQSLESQESALAEWDEDDGHPCLATYDDMAVSARTGSTKKRGGLQRLLEDIAAGKWRRPGRQLVLKVFAFDRVTRADDPHERTEVQSICNKAGVKIGVYRNMRRIYDAFDEQLIQDGIDAAKELRNITERGRAGRRAKIKRGFRPSGVAKYGMSYRKKTWFQWVPSEVSVILRMVSMFMDEDLTYYAIAKTLSAEGIMKRPTKSPRTGKPLPHGGPWRASDVRDILRFRGYTGTLRLSDKHGRWVTVPDAPLTQERWDAIQEKMDRTKLHPRTRGAQKHCNMLGGLARCGYIVSDERYSFRRPDGQPSRLFAENKGPLICGHPLHVRHRGNNPRFRSYVCSAKIGEASRKPLVNGYRCPCPGRMVWWFEGEVWGVVGDPARMEASLVDIAEERAAESAEDRTAAREEAAREIENVKIDLRNLTEEMRPLMRTSEAAKAHFREECKRLGEREAHFRSKLRDIDRRTAVRERKRVDLAGLRRVLRQWSGLESPEDRRAVCLTLGRFADVTLVTMLPDGHFLLNGMPPALNSKGNPSSSGGETPSRRSLPTEPFELSQSFRVDSRDASENDPAP